LRRVRCLGAIIQAPSQIEKAQIAALPERLQTGHVRAPSRRRYSGRRGRAKQLSDLARALHNGAPGSYEKLSAFGVKNTTSIWGARAALALGYEEYSKNRAAQGLGWLIKAQNDTLLREYALYWTAQAQRAMGRSADAYKVLQTIQHDYPNTAMREQLLERSRPPRSNSDTHKKLSMRSTPIPPRHQSPRFFTNAPAPIRQRASFLAPRRTIRPSSTNSL